MRIPLVCALLGACIGPPDLQLDSGEQAVVTPDLFGYQRMAAIGTKPAMLLLVNYDNLPPITSGAQLQSLVFGGTTFNVNAYLGEMSNGRYQLANAGLHPLSRAFEGDTAARIEHFKSDFAAQHPELADLDTNGDGRVTQDELVLIAFENQPGDYGRTGSFGVVHGIVDLNACYPIANTGKRLCSAVSTVGFQTPLLSTTHEILHNITTKCDDLYGTDVKNNANVTTMAGTVGLPANTRFHLDPFTKLALGWIEPHIVDMATSGSAPVVAPQSGAGAEEAVLLWDSTRGTDEYFLAEYRNRELGGYDASTAGTGLGLWHVGLVPGDKWNAVGPPMRNGIITANAQQDYTWNANAGVPVTVELVGDNDADLEVFLGTSLACISTRYDSFESCVVTPPTSTTITVRVLGFSPVASYNLRVSGIGADAHVYLLDPPFGGYGGNKFWASGQTSNELHWFDGSSTQTRVTLTASDAAHATIAWTSPGVIDRAGPPLGSTELAIASEGQSAVETGQRLVVFERGPDGTLRHRYYDTAWSPWSQLGNEVITSAPSAVMANGRLTVFARGSDGTLWHKYYDATWSSWISLGGTLTSAPSAVMANGRLTVFARGYDGALWQRYYEGQWRPWERINATVLGSAPSAVMAGSRLAVFARNPRGELVHTYYDAGWQPWQPLGSPKLITSAPSAVMAGSRLTVFARYVDGALGHTYFDTNWSGWIPVIGGTLGTSPSAVMNAQGRLAVYASVAGRVQETYYAMNWLAWHDL